MGFINFVLTPFVRFSIMYVRGKLSILLSCLALYVAIVLSKRLTNLLFDLIHVLIHLIINSSIDAFVQSSTHLSIYTSIHSIIRSFFSETTVKHFIILTIVLVELIYRGLASQVPSFMCLVQYVLVFEKDLYCMNVTNLKKIP